MKRISFKTIVGITSLLIIILTAAAFMQVKRTGTVLGVAAKPTGNMFFEANRQAAVSQPYTVKISVDSQNQVINSVGLRLHFDPEKIQVTDISTSASFCQFYPEKKYDNRQGIVSLACGSPPPGVKGKNQIIELTFMPMVIGTTTLRIADTSKILLNNGIGTNILTEFPHWEVQIGASL